MLLLLFIAIFSVYKVHGEDSNKKSPVVALVVANDLGTILIGGTHKGKWVNPQAITPFIKGGETYKLYSMTKFLCTSTGSKIEYAEPCDTEIISINSNDEFQVALGGDWNALPRIPSRQSNINETYLKLISDILQENGLKGVPAKITQNYRIDLEGDGIDEVLICASNINFEAPGMYQRKETYCIILFRKVIHGEVKNILLSNYFYSKDGTDEDIRLVYVDKIHSFIDANGDGVMEVIIESRYYEGYSFTLYELRDNKLVEVLENGWGA